MSDVTCVQCSGDWGEYRKLVRRAAFRAQRGLNVDTALIDSARAKAEKCTHDGGKTTTRHERWTREASAGATRPLLPPVEVGRAVNSKAKQGTQTARRHALTAADNGWLLLCSGNPAKRDFTGPRARVTCPLCRTAMRREVAA